MREKLLKILAKYINDHTHQCTVHAKAEISKEVAALVRDQILTHLQGYTAYLVRIDVLEIKDLYEQPSMVDQYVATTELNRVDALSNCVGRDYNMFTK